MNLRQDRNNSRRVWAAVLLLSVPVMALASKEDISLAFTPDHILAYITATLLIGVFVMLFLNLIYHSIHKNNIDHHYCYLHH